MRTYAEIYADLIAATDTCLVPGYDHAEHADRLADVWDEFARAAVEDQNLPSFAQLAPVLLRDRYRAQAQEIRERERRNRPLAVSQ